MGNRITRLSYLPDGGEFSPAETQKKQGKIKQSPVRNGSSHQSEIVNVTCKYFAN